MLQDKLNASQNAQPPRQTPHDAHAELLQELDSKRLSTFHLKATITAGMGFFTDAYDLFVIGTVLLLISHDSHIAKTSIFSSSLTENSALIGSSSLIAAFIGALLFGTLADRIGRKAIYGLELLIMAAGALLSAVVPTLTWLIIVRFLLGIGIGGDYPVSATIISEYANKKDRGKLIAMVFSMQAAGLIVGYVVALAVLGAGVSADLAWRILLGAGAIPALATFWLRRQVPESPRFLLEVKRDLAGARQSASIAGVTARDESSAPRSPSEFSQRLRGMWVIFTSPRYLLMLLGTAGSWFLLDYAYYGNTISSPIIINSILGEATPFQTTLAGFIILLVTAVPGYIVAMLLMDRMGRKSIQLLGFAAMAVTFGLISVVPAVRGSVAAFAVVFGISYFFTEFGPNTTTFVYPVEVFPTVVRTTGHGLSAGLGKIGAFIGVFVFPILLAQGGGKNIGLALGVAAITAILGFFLTLFTLPETTRRSLEEISADAPPAADTPALGQLS